MAFVTTKVSDIYKGQVTWRSYTLRSTACFWGLGWVPNLAAGTKAIKEEACSIIAFSMRWKGKNEQEGVEFV